MTRARWVAVAVLAGLAAIAFASGGCTLQLPTPIAPTLTALAPLSEVAVIAEDVERLPDRIVEPLLAVGPAPSLADAPDASVLGIVISRDLLIEARDDPVVFDGLNAILRNGIALVVLDSTSQEMNEVLDLKASFSIQGTSDPPVRQGLAIYFFDGASYSPLDYGLAFDNVVEVVEVVDLVVKLRNLRDVDRAYP